MRNQQRRLSTNTFPHKLLAEKHCLSFTTVIRSYHKIKMTTEPKDTFALLQHLIGCQNDQLKALERQHDDLLITIEDYYQGAVQELNLNYKNALDKEQKSFAQSKQKFEKDFLHKFISAFGRDMVHQCLGDVCVTASENTPSTISDSSPSMVSMPARVFLRRISFN